MTATQAAAVRRRSVVAAPFRDLPGERDGGNGEAMRTVSGTARVRLYFLDEGDPIAETLFYGPLEEALALAREQPESIQAGLWLATDNDVVAYLDLEQG